MDEATLKKKFGSAVRRRRETMGYSQDTFADAIGMHRAYYSAIERGERNVTLHTIKRVAIGLDVKIADVMSDAGL
ncbi:MAG: helix-turn-helix transcriptional regulator [Acidobacteria bacterium]|nr:helix-turn-helix transcriptional regulator [Acidobacteriota bacterium]